VPQIRTLPQIDLNRGVTFFVGENGSGKSTLLEGLAAAAELPALGSADIALDITLVPAQRLGAALRWYARRTMLPQLAGGLLMAGFGVMEVLRRGATAKKVVPTAADRGTTVLIVAAYALAVVAISSHWLPNVALPAPEAVGWVGVAVGLLGFSIRLWSMQVLGRFYTRTLVTTSDQQVVRTGPYRLVRHPGYLGSILVWMGAAATSGNALSLVAVTALLAIAYTHRIRTEEKMLTDALGEPYAEYRRHSWRLLPFVF